MATRNADIRINTTADVTGANKAAQAMNNVGTAATNAGKKLDAVAGSAKKGAGMRGLGQAGLQMQDVIVGAQMGQKASTILLQQGSQLLGVFGPQGAIAGAVLALGVIMYTTLSSSINAVDENAKEMAKNLSDALDTAKKKARETAKEFDSLQESTHASLMAGDKKSDVESQIEGIDKAISDATTPAEAEAAATKAIRLAKELQSASVGLFENSKDRAVMESSLKAQQSLAAQRHTEAMKSGVSPDQYAPYQSAIAGVKDTRARLEADQSAQGRTGASSLKDLDATIKALGESAKAANDKITQINTAQNVQSALDKPAAAAIAQGFAGSSGGGFAGQDQSVVAKAQEAKAKDDALSQISAILADGQVTASEGAGLVAAIKTLQSTLQTGNENQKQATSTLVEAVKALAAGHGDLKKQVAEAMAAVARVTTVTSS